MIYYGSSPEFRILVKENGLQIMQVRYVNMSTGYTGQWHDIPIIKE